MAENNMKKGILHQKNIRNTKTWTAYLLKKLACIASSLILTRYKKIRLQLVIPLLIPYVIEITMPLKTNILVNISGS